MRRSLTPGEAALWRRVARHARPLAGKALPDATDAPPEAPLRKSKAIPSARAEPSGKPQRGPLADRGGERRVQRGKLEIAARLDLHGYTQDAARQALAAFVDAQVLCGARTVLVITGKSGVLRQRLPDWLSLPDLRQKLAGFAQAHRQHGGEGAWYVFLRENRPLSRR